jgi:hypothetical protein
MELKKKAKTDTILITKAGISVNRKGAENWNPDP